MNPFLANLQTYPFEKLKSLINGIQPDENHKAISLAIGEPKHPTPGLISDALIKNLNLLDKYPTTRGSDLLRQTCVNWLCQRFSISTKILNKNDHVLPVNGTREALFAFAQCAINPSNKPVVLIPNPFYQIYEGAALLAGAEPIYYDCKVIENDMPALWEIENNIWERCQIIYICTPGNPTGQLVPELTLKRLIEYSLRFNFIIASDECYSEIYPHESKPPMGLLHFSEKYSNDGMQNCIAFYSLSKRSNAPGLRSGFIAGSADLIKQFLQYRTYHGCAMSLPTQYASIAAWSDETHVIDNRNKYNDKFNSVIDLFDNVLPCTRPEAGFYLWPKIPMNDEVFSKVLFSKKNILTLPGTYLARTINGYNPGENRVRLALVATKQECVEAASRISNFLRNL